MSVEPKERAKGGNLRLCGVHFNGEVVVTLGKVEVLR